MSRVPTRATLLPRKQTMTYSDIVTILSFAPECDDIADRALDRLWAVATIDARVSTMAATIALNAALAAMCAE